jgi:hypothetical protein
VDLIIESGGRKLLIRYVRRKLASTAVVRQFPFEIFMGIPARGGT